MTPAPADPDTASIELFIDPSRDQWCQQILGHWRDGILETTANEARNPPVYDWSFVSHEGTAPAAIGETSRNFVAFERTCSDLPPETRRCLATVPGEDCVPDDDTTRVTYFAYLAPRCQDAGLSGSTEYAQTFLDGITDRDRGIIRTAAWSVIADECEVTNWNDTVMRCVTGENFDGTMTIWDCFHMGGVDGFAASGDRLQAELARRRELFTTAAAFAPTDKAIACAAVAAAYYDRSLKTSRAAMIAACKAEAWTPFERGCVVTARTAEDRGLCLPGDARWTYPASAAPAPPPIEDPTGIAACDAFVVTATRHAACPGLPDAARVVGLEMLRLMQSTWMNPTATAKLDADHRAATEQECRSGVDYLRMSANELRCSI